MALDFYICSVSTITIYKCIDILLMDLVMIHSPICKLTEETVEEIYIELREGTISQDIADMFGVSRGLIDHVNHGISWAVTGMSYPIRKREKKVKVLSDKSYEFPIADCYPCAEWEKRNG